MTEPIDIHADLTRWPCGVCGRLTATRHPLQRGSVFAHDPLAAAGLTDPEPSPPGTDREATP